MTTVIAGSAIPAQVEILQLAVAGCQQRRHDVRHHPEHQHLAFGIAEADIVFEQLRSLLPSASGRHRARRWNGMPRRLHAGQRRQDDPRHDLRRGPPASRTAPANRRPCRRCSVPRHGRTRACGPARDASGIAVSPSHSAKKLTSLAVQEFLDHDFGAGRAEAAVEHHGDGGFRLRQRLRDHHALAGGKAVGLDHDRRALLAHIGQRVGGGVEALDRRRSGY